LSYIHGEKKTPPSRRPKTPPSRGERDIPKNVFFLREEVLIYDAPESATFPRMFSSSARRF
jgi:hypothetical protein